ncbi:MAG: type II toxin-antitoxin system RelE/ParE family toxin [Phycisphaerae bacterium]|nr:type II toxin-antitoxin system RelE/ParE family toxin [Phycisphaerae bacterium]
MIVTFACKQTRLLFERQKTKLFSGKLWRAAYRKLVMLHAAHCLSDLNVPPGNRLEALRGSRRGQHSIRINEKWRICFVWRDGNAHDVEIVDYH